MACMETENLIPTKTEGHRQGNMPDKGPEWDSKLPYGGRVYLARRKKPDSTCTKVMEAVVIIGTLMFACYAYCCYDNLHFHCTHGYAHLGYASAQHQVGQRYLHGKGVDKHHGKAMEWFREAHTLIHHAASKGVKQAHKVLNNVCTRGGC